MYITINNIKGEKRIDLSYSIQNFVSSKEVELKQFAVDDQVIKKNKLKGITEMIINLDEFNNSDNLEDGHPSNSLLTYHVTDDKHFTQYRKLKDGEFTSLTLRIMDQAGNIITDGPQVTIVLHIKYNPL